MHARDRMIAVIDIGCYAHSGGDASIPYLLDEFDPDLLFGFDPLTTDREWTLPGRRARIVERAAAMWTHDGTVPFERAATSSSAFPDDDRLERVSCVDVVRVVRELLEKNGGGLVVKMDAEGGEYVLLPALLEAGLVPRIALLWVEWHCPTCRRGSGDGRGHRDNCAAMRDGLDVPERVVELSDAVIEAGCEVHPWNR